MMKISFFIVTALMFVISGKAMATPCTFDDAAFEAYDTFMQQCMVLDLKASHFPSPDLKDLSGRITPIINSENEQIFLLTRYSSAISISSVGACDQSTGTLVILGTDANFYQPLKKTDEDISIDGFSNFGKRRSLDDCGRL